MRHELQKARKVRNWTQKQVAEKLGISTRFYQSIEGSTRKGNIELWDKIEDLFGVPQRQLRENTNT